MAGARVQSTFVTRRNGDEVFSALFWLLYQELHYAIVFVIVQVFRMKSLPNSSDIPFIERFSKTWASKLVFTASRPARNDSNDQPRTTFHLLFLPAP